MSLTNLASLDPLGLSTAAGEILDLVDSLQIASSRIVIGGFSQGSMVALDAALRMRPFPAGVLILSGGIIAEQRLTATLESRKAELGDLRVFQFHGEDDPVLPFSQGRLLGQKLTSAGAIATFTAFAGGHGIPQSVCNSVADAIDSMLGSA
jgi:phospholipase/carboxylesterase